MRSRSRSWLRRVFGPGVVVVAFLLSGGLLTGAGCHGRPARHRLLVAAAMSLHDVLPTVVDAFRATHPDADVALDFGGSGTLARQIEAGAPVDLFISADVATVDGLGRRVVARRDVLSTGLVVVVPRGGTSPPSTPAALAKVSRLAIGNDTVPAGRYARAYLKRVKIWDAVKDRLVPGDHVRAVLAAVASGAVPAGIVYATDAKVEPRVRVAYAIPAADVPPVRYVAAVIQGAPNPAGARAFMAYLEGPAARQAFEAAGFTVLGGEGVGAPGGGAAGGGGTGGR